MPQPTKSWISEWFDGLDCCITLFPPWPLFALIACRGGVVGDQLRETRTRHMGPQPRSPRVSESRTSSLMPQASEWAFSHFELASNVTTSPTRAARLTGFTLET